MTLASASKGEGTRDSGRCLSQLLGKRLEVGGPAFRLQEGHSRTEKNRNGYLLPSAPLGTHTVLTHCLA